MLIKSKYVTIPLVKNRKISERKIKKRLELEQCSNQEKAAIRDCLLNINIYLSAKTYLWVLQVKLFIKLDLNRLYILNLKKNSIINTPYSRPIWVILKELDASGSKKWRLVIDYRKFNERANNNKYPLPNLSNIEKNIFLQPLT